MGEAKRRKQADPNFGRIPKRPDYRGLVICPPLEIEGTRVRIKSISLHPQELRFALLFWDRLVWPSSRAIHIPSGPDEQFLEAAGVLKRPDYTFNGDAAQGMAMSQYKAYRDLEEREPGVWALAQGENTLLWKEGLVDQDSGSAIELHRAIPIPKHDVPLAEILEFKHRRRDELRLLRQHLESFVCAMESSDDRPKAFQEAVGEIDVACANLLKIGKEWQSPVYLSNMKAAFSLAPVKFVPSFVAGWKLGEPFGLAAASAVAAAVGAASTLEIKSDFGLRGIKRPASPYRYAYHIDKELR